MPIVSTSAKGQVVIPAALRKKVGLKPGGRVLVTVAGEDTVIIRPLPEDPIEAACGSLKGGPSLTRALLGERDEERRRDETKRARLFRPDRLSRKGTRVRKGSHPVA
jgi:AbrB family looped-hinge helix DNA binding protein